MSIQKIFGIMNQLETQSAKTIKEQILKNNEGDTDFREALIFLLNPYIVTGISTKKMNKDLADKYYKIKRQLMNISDMISFLKDNNTGTDYSVSIVQEFANRQETEELKIFVKKLATKDLKLGISEKTVNKVYGKGTIPSFAVMLAESYAKKESKVQGKFYITQKLDGNRCVAIKENGKVSFFSRKGQQIESLVELEKEFEYMPNDFAFDGELLLVNKDNLPSDELFRATQKVVRKDGEKKNLNFYMFDLIPIEQFREGKSKEPYGKRRVKLGTLFQFRTLSVNHVNLAPHLGVLPTLYEGEDKNQIAELMKWAEENKYEGLMLNTANGLYETKRTDNLLKIKKFSTADLLCVSVEEGTGKNIGKLGRINVQYKENSVGIGSGFTDEQREYFWKNPNEIVGKIIETQYFEESKDEKTDLPSLRFPVFKCIRTDKGVEDISYE